MFLLPEQSRPEVSAQLDLFKMIPLAPSRTHSPANILSDVLLTAGNLLVAFLYLPFRWPCRIGSTVLSFRRKIPRLPIRRRGRGFCRIRTCQAPVNRVKILGISFSRLYSWIKIVGIRMRQVLKHTLKRRPRMNRWHAGGQSTYSQECAVHQRRCDDGERGIKERLEIDFEIIPIDRAITVHHYYLLTVALIIKK
jgi:hypothetical protein